MPSYNFRRKSTGEEWTDFMSISEMESTLSSDSDMEIAPPDTCAQLDPWRMGRQKPPDGFREITRRVKRFYKDSTVTD